MQEGRHVILEGAVSGRHYGAEKSYEARLGTTVIELNRSTLRSANNNVKEFTARPISYHSLKNSVVFFFFKIFLKLWILFNLLCSYTI